MLATLLGACAGIVGWMLVEVIKTGRANALGLASGALSGLVAITPAYVVSGGALVIDSVLVRGPSAQATLGL